MNSDMPLTPEATPLVRNACGGAISGNKHWYVAVVRPRYERISRDLLCNLGYEAYIAGQKDTRVYACRHRREVECIIIPNLVFVHVTEKERRLLLRQCTHIHHFMTDRAGLCNENGHRPLAVIPDAQMEMLRFMLYHAERPVAFVSTPLSVGHAVRVIRGVLAGLEGEVVTLHEGSSPHVGIRIDWLGYATLQVAPEDVERIG